MDGSGPPGEALHEERLGTSHAAAPDFDHDRGHTAPEEALIRRLTRERLLARDRPDMPPCSAMSLWGFDEATPAE